MLGMLRDLIQHKDWASVALFTAIQNHETAASDEALRMLLHHIVLANRFWLFACLDRPFAVDEESRVPESLTDVIERCRATHAVEAEWIFTASDSDLTRRLEGPLIPGGGCSMAQAYMQVCMHSQGHRSQCASRLRALGGEPPVTDFIVWLVERPAAQWLG